ncbi:MAG: alanine racemase [Chloroflexota bacterium]
MTATRMRALPRAEGRPAPAPAATATATSTATTDDRPRRGRPPARNEILRSGRLGGLEPELLAAEFGTPFYAYDLDVIDRQVAALRAILPPAFELAYATKANPALAIVDHLARLGLGADVASGGELEVATRAGLAPASIVFTGPGKRDAELAAAVDLGIRAVTVESNGELARLERLAAISGRVIPVLLRAAVPAAVGRERVRLVGDDGAGKFGMDENDLERAARAAHRSPHLDLIGLHAFGASNVVDADVLGDHVERTVDQARRLAQRVGFRLRLVDVGGGLGVPYELDDRALDLAALGLRLAVVAARLEADAGTRGARILLEPGRFLVGPAGAYVARVVDRKSVAGSHVVVLDGGIHHVLRPALVGQEHRIRALGGSAGSSSRAFPVTIAGPLCSGLDILAAQAVMPVPAVGELVAVLDVGAYGYTESMPFFLSHPVPPEVAISAGRAALIRRRIEPAAWLEAQSVPAWRSGQASPAGTGRNGRSPSVEEA